MHTFLVALIEGRERERERKKRVGKDTTPPNNNNNNNNKELKTVSKNYLFKPLLCRQIFVLGAGTATINLSSSQNPAD
jgi:hypothetical protein